MQETQETPVRSLGWKDPQEEETATCSSILAWRNQRQRSLVGYSPWVPNSWPQLSDQAQAQFISKLSTGDFLFSPFSQHWKVNLTWINYYFSWGVGTWEENDDDVVLFAREFALSHKAFPLSPFWPPLDYGKKGPSTYCFIYYVSCSSSTALGLHWGAGYSLGAVLELLMSQSMGSRANRLQKSWHVGSVVGTLRL